MTEGLEKGVPPLDERIETFKTLVKKLGKGRVIWRFDPLILTDRISQDDLATGYLAIQRSLCSVSPT